MADNRKALGIGSIIVISDDKRIEIVSEAGRGANCIVYGAIYNDNIGVKHNIRLKECYPAYLFLKRKETQMNTGFPTPNYYNRKET